MSERRVVVTGLGVNQLRLVTNLGYGLALQAGIKYAIHCGYDIVVTIDADGQHQARDVPSLVDALINGNAALVIGSRFGSNSSYDAPFSRKIGQSLFSFMTALILRHRIYDTSSGFKAFQVQAFATIIDRAFMDFHIEAIVHLSLIGHKIIEVPVEMLEREHGNSMHSLTSLFHYPLKTLLLTIVATMDAFIGRRTL